MNFTVLSFFRNYYFYGIGLYNNVCIILRERNKANRTKMIGNHKNKRNLFPVFIIVRIDIPSGFRCYIIYNFFCSDLELNATWRKMIKLLPFAFVIYNVIYIYIYLQEDISRHCIRIYYIYFWFLLLFFTTCKPPPPHSSRWM